MSLTMNTLKKASRFVLVFIHGEGAVTCNANDSAPNLDINANIDSLVTSCINELWPVHIDLTSVKTFVLEFLGDKEMSFERLDE